MDKREDTSRQSFGVDLSVVVLFVWLDLSDRSLLRSLETCVNIVRFLVWDDVGSDFVACHGLHMVDDSRVASEFCGQLACAEVLVESCKESLVLWPVVSRSCCYRHIVVWINSWEHRLCYQYTDGVGPQSFDIGLLDVEKRFTLHFWTSG